MKHSSSSLQNMSISYLYCGTSSCCTSASLPLFSAGRCASTISAARAEREARRGDLCPQDRAPPREVVASLARVLFRHAYEGAAAQSTVAPGRHGPTQGDPQEFGQNPLGTARSRGNGSLAWPPMPSAVAPRSGIPRGQARHRRVGDYPERRAEPRVPGSHHQQVCHQCHQEDAHGRHYVRDHQPTHERQEALVPLRVEQPEDAAGDVHGRQQTNEGVLAPFSPALPLYAGECPMAVLPRHAQF